MNWKSIIAIHRPIIKSIWDLYQILISLFFSFPFCVNAWSKTYTYLTIVMYITTSTSAASSLLRASSRSRFVSSLSSFKSLPARSLSPSPSPSSLVSQRSLGFASAVRSFRCSVPRWSHRVDWRSPLSLRAQIRTVAPAIERLERAFATMGTVFHFRLFWSCFDQLS